MTQVKQQIIWNNFSELADINLSAGEELEVIGVFCEGLATKKKLVAKLAGNGANLKMTLIFIGKESNHFDLECVFDHENIATVSDITIKAVMFDESNLNFLGNVVIPESGQKSEASLRCQTLLMSHNSKAKTIPSLEIVANDVKAGHAASVGRVDDELMFYLETRGFDKNTAERLLVEGFLLEALNKLDESLREKLWKNIFDQLPIYE